jgi:aryl-alcohol dehydrogenase-like predicted oxidoreductase
MNLLDNNLPSLNKFTLGTAQLGLPYGIANQQGMLGSEEAKALVEKAIEYGITTFDTARAYGISEKRLGQIFEKLPTQALQVVTKLDPLSFISALTPKKEIEQAVENSVLRSLLMLKKQSLDTLLLHRWSHRHLCDAQIWQTLLALKEEGLINRLGASVDNVLDAIAALADPDIEHLQIPFNLLDWRWQNDQFAAAVKKRPDVTLHVRSVLLQGLLANPSVKWPVLPEMDAAKIASSISGWVKKLNRQNSIDLCYAYIRSFPWISSLIIGLESVEQLEMNLSLFQTPPLTLEEADQIQKSFKMIPEKLLNPAHW